MSHETAHEQHDEQVVVVPALPTLPSDVIGDLLERCTTARGAVTAVLREIHAGRDHAYLIAALPADILRQALFDATRELYATLTAAVRVIEGRPDL